MQIPKLRLSFLINALVVTLAVSIPVPFIFQVAKNVPLLSLFLGEVSLIFLVVLASFPKAGIGEVVRLGMRYLLFIGLCFALLSFVPFEPKHKLFAFRDFLDGNVPNLVTINVIGLLVMNAIACTFFGFEYNRSEEKQQSRRWKTYEQRVQEEEENFQRTAEEDKFTSKLRGDVNSLFDLYLRDYELGEIDENQKLENIEGVLLNNLHAKVNGAMCVDGKGNILHDSVFHWSGYDREALLELFAKQSEVSENLATGKLCQMMLRDTDFWYIISKFRGNYLILQTEEEDPSSLLDTGYKVFRELRLAP